MGELNVMVFALFVCKLISQNELIFSFCGLMCFMSLPAASVDSFSKKKKGKKTIIGTHYTISETNDSASIKY